MEYEDNRTSLPSRSVSHFNEELICIKYKTKISEVKEKPDLGKTDKDDEEEGGLNPTQGRGRTERDDEEEWGRVPIPQSDDSDDSTWWEGSDPYSKQAEDNAQREDEKPTGMNEQEKQVYLAFLIGPRRDGIIRRKDGTLLTTHDVPILTQIEATKIPKPSPTSTVEGDLPDTNKRQHKWTSLIMAIQHLNLKMKYTVKTKTRARLMREIKQHALKTVLGSPHDTQKGATL